MGAPAVTTTPFQLYPPREITKMRRTGIWMSVVGGVLTLIGGLTVLVTRGDSGPSGVSQTRPAVAIQDGTDTATTIVGAAAANRQPGTIDPGTPAVTPGSPTAPPPATPQEVAALLASLPVQMQQAATAGGQPHELTPEEVNKIVDDLLRQLGAKP
ncbi:MAG: hypothetical protein QOG43_2446 [Actinomycetota bacterium]|jgi:hypothetical protein|nr:hypothetical protein [Actinomycetota bacterium]